jgi:hypothetical protein
MKRNPKLIYLFIITTCLIFFLAVDVNAQDLRGTLVRFRDQTIRPLYPIIIGVVFLIGAMMNIGEVWGEHKNWKAFLSKVGIYIGICLIIIAVYEFVSGLSV